jgi:hypothetical protein
MPLAHQIAAHKSWANTPNRTERTAPARNGLENKFLVEAGGDQQRAQSLRKAYYLELALKSAKARKRRREAQEAGPVTFSAAGGHPRASRGGHSSNRAPSLFVVVVEIEFVDAAQAQILNHRPQIDGAVVGIEGFAPGHVRI